MENSPKTGPPKLVNETIKINYKITQLSMRAVYYFISGHILSRHGQSNLIEPSWVIERNRTPTKLIGQSNSIERLISEPWIGFFKTC